MNSLKKDIPLFLGLSHIGQVFSIGWSQKIGKCAVFDYDKNQKTKFKNLRVTNEEPELKNYLAKNIKKIYFCENEKEIKNFNIIFLTIDTPLSMAGAPDVKKIINILKKSYKNFKKNCTIIITSQVYCGFCEDLKKTIFKNRPDINLIYFAETLVMGKALERFTNPERIILGFDKKVKFLKEFEKFNCKIFQFSLREAEMIKMAINLFLFTSVNYANAMDYYCRQYGFKFSKINKALKSDKRIGKDSYISPSLGVSGGHLERDVFTIIRTSKNQKLKNFFLKMKSLDNSRISILINKYEKLKSKFKFKKIIWIGPSYKSKSFSIVNSPFLKFKKYLKKKKKILYSYDSFFDLKKQKIKNCIQELSIKDLKEALLIYNYSKIKDKQKINKFINSKFCKIISFNSTNFKNKNEYVIN